MKSPIHSTSDLARLLGLSRWTVSRALNGHKGLNSETVARVHEAAKAHGFAPSVLGRGLRSGRTDMVGICVPDLEDYFLTTKISALNEMVAAEGFHSVIQIVDGSKASENAALERFSAMRCAGVVVMASRLRSTDAGLRNLATRKVPIVRIDPAHEEGGVFIATDRAHAMREAVQHLHDLGHRGLTTLGIQPGSPYGSQRMRGLEEGCELCGWKFARDVRVLTDPEASEDFSLGLRLAGTYLARRRKKDTAVIAINDRAALAFARGLAEAGVAVPKEVSIIGYDDADFAGFATPALTTINPNVTELIEHAVDLITSLIKNPEKSRRATILVKPRLIVRQSTGPT